MPILMLGCSPSEGDSAHKNDASSDSSYADPTDQLVEDIDSDLGEEPVTLWSDGLYRAAVDYYPTPSSAPQHLYLQAELIAGSITGLRDLATKASILPDLPATPINAVGSAEIRLPSGAVYRVQLEEEFPETR